MLKMKVDPEKCMKTKGRGQNARNNIGHLCPVEAVFAENRGKFVPE
jgi:hypothetical protein